MRRTGALQEVPLTRFEMLPDRHERGKLSQAEAAERFGDWQADVSALAGSVCRVEQLGIAHIALYSPQARDPSARVFRTLQDRRPKELRLAGRSLRVWRKLRREWGGPLGADRSAFGIDPKAGFSKHERAHRRAPNP